MPNKYDLVCERKVGGEWWESVEESDLSKYKAQKRVLWFDKLVKAGKISNIRKPRFRVMLTLPEKTIPELEEWWDNQLTDLERDVLLSGVDHDLRYGESTEQRLERDRSQLPSMYYEWATTKHPKADRSKDTDDVDFSSMGHDPLPTF